MALPRLFRDACCVDIWRYLHPSAQGFTSRADGLVSSRIDLVACPFVWVTSASSCDILPCPFSDHCASAFSLEPPGVVPPGPGLWKLNASVLLDVEYCSTIRDFWVGWRLRKGDFPSLVKWRDAGKAKIKGLTVSHCVRRSQRSSQSRTLFKACRSPQGAAGFRNDLVPWPVSVDFEQIGSIGSRSCEGRSGPLTCEMC